LLRPVLWRGCRRLRLRHSLRWTCRWLGRILCRACRLLRRVLCRSRRWLGCILCFLAAHKRKSRKKRYSYE
jgi:hypothetical protein